MTNWTPVRSVLLSQLLDDVVGTEEMVHIRQDYCRIIDCKRSTTDSDNTSFYYTGSKAEGLDLPGSDDDYMIDINNRTKLLIIQSMKDAPTAAHRNVFCMETENVPPCFAMLRSVNQVQPGVLFDACQFIDNAIHLSSYLLVNNIESELNKVPLYKVARQGPSVEHWTPYMDTSQSGIDAVLSIHCPYWPATASEWKLRHRRFSWPSPHDIKSIGDFGFHLVPVGHPRSDMNMMEWRMSFSVAERTLVWSFNHVQIQCYAVMKIILKEFINPHCSPDNRVLCSYFIKTFLFWKYEETDSSFWSPENFRECIMFLLSGFYECILRGSLKHYFIPGFNLLSVKLTTEAREEILIILDTVLQYDISIMKECNTLTTVWDKFVNHNESGIRDSVLRRQKLNILKTDACMIRYMAHLQHTFSNFSQSDLVRVVHWFVSRCFQNVQITCLLSFVVQMILLLLSKSVVGHHTSQNYNRTVYRSWQYLRLNTSGFDISTYRLWYAILMTMRSDYRLSLRVLNTILSSIPPFALHRPYFDLHYSNDTKNWYVDVFSTDDKSVAERARAAWMFDIIIMPSDADTVPTAIQIELTHCDKSFGVHLSPFVFTYYLMFLNYHALHQYENRDRALCQLVETVNNPVQCGGFMHHSYNIAGHCLLYMGLCEHARDMFLRSYQFASNMPPFHLFNSARLYLQYLQF